MKHVLLAAVALGFLAMGLVGCHASAGVEPNHDTTSMTLGR